MSPSSQVTKPLCQHKDLDERWSLKSTTWPCSGSCLPWQRWRWQKTSSNLCRDGRVRFSRRGSAATACVVCCVRAAAARAAAATSCVCVRRHHRDGRSISTPSRRRRSRDGDRTCPPAFASRRWRRRARVTRHRTDAAAGTTSRRWRQGRTTATPSRRHRHRNDGAATAPRRAAVPRGRQFTPVHTSATAPPPAMDAPRAGRTKPRTSSS